MGVASWEFGVDECQRRPRRHLRQLPARSTSCWTCRSRAPKAEHDEILFIVIHQVYELWFKELLHEFDRVMDAAARATKRARAQHTLKRVLTILKVLVAQVDILETMTPLEFLTFRNRLAAASGFQSDQFRQLEFVLGNKSRAAIERFGAGHTRPHRARRAMGGADAVGRVSPVPANAKAMTIPAGAARARRHRARSSRHRRSSRS